MKRRFSRCKTFNQCEKKLTCSILSLYSYISRFIDMHTNRGWTCRSPFMFVNGSEINEQLYRGPPKDASYQILIHLAKRFQRRLFRNQPIRNKNCLWRTCLLMDWDEMSNLYRKPAIDASYQVLLHLVEGFQRRRLKCEKLTDDGCQVMAKAHLAFVKVS